MLHPLRCPEHYGKLVSQPGLGSKQCLGAVSYRASGLPGLLRLKGGVRSGFFVSADFSVCIHVELGN